MTAEPFLFDESLIGRWRSELETPVVCVDLDRLDANLRSLAGFIAQHGKAWRPHFDCHESPHVAIRQIQAGAAGVTVPDVDSAESVVRAGIREVLIANPVVGESKLERAAKLCDAARLAIACDHFVQGEALAQACRRRGVCCGVLIDVNLGQDRTGVRAGWDAVDLARGLHGLPAIHIVGVFGNVDHLAGATDPQVQRQELSSALSLLEELRDRMRQEGIPCDVVAAARAEGSLLACEHAAVTEVHVGTVFGDSPGQCSTVTVIATVLSRSKLERAVLDVGERVLGPTAASCRIDETVSGRPLPDAVVMDVDAEHLVLALGPGSQDLVIGDKVVVSPASTIWLPRLNHRLVAVGRDRVQEVWTCYRIVPTGNS